MHLCSRVGIRSTLVTLRVFGSTETRIAIEPRSQTSLTVLVRVPLPLSVSPTLQFPHGTAAANCRRNRTASRVGAAIDSTTFASHPPKSFPMVSIVFVISASGGNTGAILMNCTFGGMVGASVIPTSSQPRSHIIFHVPRNAFSGSIVVPGRHTPWSFAKACQRDLRTSAATSRNRLSAAMRFASASSHLIINCDTSACADNNAGDGWTTRGFNAPVLCNSFSASLKTPPKPPYVLLLIPIRPTPYSGNQRISEP